MKRHPAADLIMGTCDSPKYPTRQVPARIALLKKFASSICRRGNYSVALIGRDEGGSFAVLAVERREDLDRLVRLLGAHSSPRFGNWRTCSTFCFSSRTYGQIVTRLMALRGASP